MFFQMNVCMSYKNVAIDRTDVSERIDINKTSASKECMFCHFWYFKDGFRIESHVYDICQNILMTACNLKCLAVLNFKRS